MDVRVLRINLGSPEGIKLREQYKIREGVQELVRLFFVGELLDEDKDADGTRPVMITTDGIDRMNEVVDPKGIDLENFKKNPVILFAHRYDLPPIGSAQWIQRREKGIVAKPRFANTQFAQEIKQLYTDGHMKAWSIGFIPLEVQPGDGKKGSPSRIYTKSELLEFSAVPVPANPEALSMAMSKGLSLSPDVQTALGIAATHAAEDPPPASVVVDGKDTEIAALKAQLDQRDQQIAALKEQVTMLEQRPEPTSEPRIRIIESAQPGDAVIRVHGAPESLDAFRQELAGAVDGRVKRLTGRVS